MLSSRQCNACNHALQWDDDYSRCRQCGLWQSRLSAQILDEQAWQQLDETARGTALATLRRNNFSVLLQRLAVVRGQQGGALLDVGSAHGWFVVQAMAAGYKSLGLEPDPRLAAYAREHGATIKQGFFPQALAADERFDVIVFNDVFEHLPDPVAALAACAAHLQAEGLLVLNLPLASGCFFHMAEWLNKLGIKGPWRRLWQVGFPSPHLFFFESRQLVPLATAAGFSLISESALQSLTTAGLWARLRMDHQQPVWLHMLQWLLLVALLPMVGLMPNDIGLFIFRLNQRR